MGAEDHRRECDNNTEDTMSEEKPVESYKEATDNKGRDILKPTYITKTPDSEIERLNKMFPRK